MTTEIRRRGETPQVRERETFAAAIDARVGARLAGLLEGVETGRIDLVDESGRRRAFGELASSLRAEVRLVRPRALRRVLQAGEIGLGEAYVDGDWDADDLAALVEIAHRNAAVFDGRELAGGAVSRLAARALHALRFNSRRGSRRNIEAHYDLGNELYAAMLDATMSYSCAVFERPDDTLERAQRNKMAAILRKGRVEPRHHVLEIGCGWGGLAIEAARTIGCRVTGITLSREQLAWAREAARRAGVADRVTFELRDYRRIEGTYDRVVSVEMVEAVGHRNLGRFFAACDAALAPGGRAVLQAITVPDDRYDAYRTSCDWLRKYIFPGGHAPSMAALRQAMERASSLVVLSAENIGLHYAATLRAWRRRFEAAWPRLSRRGYDERFRRTWRYYLAYCEGGFAAGTFGDLQLVLARAPGRGGAP